MYVVIFEEKNCYSKARKIIKTKYLLLLIGFIVLGFIIYVISVFAETNSENRLIADVEAMINSGEYYDAYTKLKPLGEQSEEIKETLDILKELIYIDAEKAYDEGDILKAKKLFLTSYPFEKSNDYLILLDSKINSLKGTTTIYGKNDSLFTLLNFKDTKEIIYDDVNYMLSFLKGKWEEADTGRQFFEVGYSGDIWGRFLEEKGKVHSFENNDLYVEQELDYNIKYANTYLAKPYNISILDKNTISVYCYTNDELYILCRYY